MVVMKWDLASGLLYKRTQIRYYNQELWGCSKNYISINNKINKMKYLKKGLEASEIKKSDEQVRVAVSEIINSIEKKGDEAVRQYSKKFDNWEPENFRLSAQEVERIIASLPQSVVDDILFAQ